MFMSTITGALLIAFGLPVGFLVGLMGVGGVLLAPTLIHVAGMNSHDAISLTLASFIPVGAVALAMNGRSGTILSRNDWVLLTAIVPGAAVGARLMHVVPSHGLALLISAAVALSGVWTLARPAATRLEKNAFGAYTGAAIGFAAGALSAFSGTSGPLVLIPILLWIGTDIKHALSLALPAQLPIAMAATVANELIAPVDFKSACLIGLALVAGLIAGSKVSRSVDPGRLTIVVAWSLVVIGATFTTIDLLKLARGGL